MIKRGFLNCLWIVSIWYIIIMVINCIIKYPWKLFLYDILSGFRDNNEYMVKILFPITIFTMILCLFFVKLLDSNLVMFWKVRIGKRSFRIGDITFIRKHKKILMILTFVLAFGLLSFVSYGKTGAKTKSPWTGSQTIAHAGGIINGCAYTNCMEAILVNYNEGQRVFEIDFAMTSDNKLVCKHKWSEVLQEGGIAGEAMDLQTFMSTPILGQYTPLSWQTLCQLMDEYPDIWIVTDTKHTDTENIQKDFEMLVGTAQELGKESVLDRIIVQIYNEEMYATVYQIYPFKSFIYTLYKFWKGDAETFLDCVRFCHEHDFTGITTWNYRVNADLMQIADAYNIPWYCHTENDVENARDMFQLGIRGIYTDSIVPDMLADDKAH